MEPRDLPATGTITIYGSYGSLRVDRHSGAVLHYTPYPDDTAEYADIARFDVNEARLHYADEWPGISRLDIIRIGFWTAAGAYIPNDRAALDGAAKREGV